MHCHALQFKLWGRRHCIKLRELRTAKKWEAERYPLKKMHASYLGELDLACLGWLAGRQDNMLSQPNHWINGRNNFVLEDTRKSSATSKKNGFKSLLFFFFPPCLLRLNVLHIKEKEEKCLTMNLKDISFLSIFPVQGGTWKRIEAYCKPVQNYLNRIRRGQHCLVKNINSNSKGFFSH